MCLAIMDTDCNLGIVQKDFINNKDISAKVSQVCESDINLDDFEMADLEEQQDAKITVQEVLEKPVAVGDDVEIQDAEIEAEVHEPVEVS